MYKKIFKNSAIYGILPQLPKLASFFILPLTTPFLTKADYGVVGILAAYIGAISSFHMIGLQLVASNAYIHHPSQFKWYWRQIYGFLWQWSFVYFALLATVLYFIIPEEASAHKFEIIALKIIPAFIFGPSDMLTSVYFRMQQKALPIATRSLFAGLIGIGLNYYFIAVLKMGYMGWIVSEFITTCISGILFIIPFYSLKFYPIFNFKRRLIKRALKVSLPFVPHYYANYLLRSSDRVVMNQFHVSTAEIGRYSMAFNFGVYMETVANAINQAVSPNLLELIKKGKWKEYQRLIFAFQAIILSLCFTVSLWVADWVPFLIRNKELQDIHFLVIIVVMSYSCKPVYIGCNMVLFYYEKTNVLWKITFVAGALNVLANVIFVPSFGVDAAAIITFITLMYMGFSGFFFRVIKMHNKANLKPLLWFVLIILCTTVATLFHDNNILSKLIINLIFLVVFFIIQFKAATYKNNDVKQTS